MRIHVTPSCPRARNDACPSFRLAATALRRHSTHFCFSDLASFCAAPACCVVRIDPSVARCPRLGSVGVYQVHAANGHCRTRAGIPYRAGKRRYWSEDRLARLPVVWRAGLCPRSVLRSSVVFFFTLFYAFCWCVGSVTGFRRLPRTAWRSLREDMVSSLALK